jgi:hypothetical protein
LIKTVKRKEIIYITNNRIPAVNNLGLSVLTIVLRKKQEINEMKSNRTIENFKSGPKENNGSPLIKQKQIMFPLLYDLFA